MAEAPFGVAELSQDTHCLTTKACQEQPPAVLELGVKECSGYSVPDERKSDRLLSSLVLPNTFIPLRLTQGACCAQNPQMVQKAWTSVQWPRARAAALSPNRHPASSPAPTFSGAVL